MNQICVWIKTLSEITGNTLTKHLHINTYRNGECVKQGEEERKGELLRKWWRQEDVMSDTCSGTVLRFYSTQCSFTVNKEKFQALTLFCPSVINHANSYSYIKMFKIKHVKKIKWIPADGATNPWALPSSWQSHKHLYKDSSAFKRFYPINTKTQETFSKIMIISASGSNLTSSFLSPNPKNGERFLKVQLIFIYSPVRSWSSYSEVF